MKPLTHVLMALLMLFLFNINSIAQIPDTLTAIQDNTLYENVNGSLSSGAGIYFFVGRNNNSAARRGLLKFPIADSTLSEAIIDSVKLVLNMSRTLAGVEAISVHRLLADWGEGASNAGIEGGGGAPSQSGDATWIHTFFNSGFWTNSGGDFSPAASATQDVGDIGKYIWSSEQMAVDVEDWKNNPATNFGWILIGDENQNQTSKRFDSKENLVDSNKPRLIVHYTPATAVAAGEVEGPLEFYLHQNYPNPFNPTTTIRYEVKNQSLVSLKVFDLLGEELRTLVEGRIGPGIRQVEWDGTNQQGEHLASGIYICRLQIGDRDQFSKMTLLR